MRSSPFSRTTSIALLFAVALVACHQLPVATTSASVQRVGGATRHHRGLDAVGIFERHHMALRDSIVRFALAQVGTRYVFGGAAPETGFDCSGLVQYVFSHTYIAPPRTAHQQSRIGAPIRRDRLRPGDVLTFGAGDSVTHVGIYIGERLFVHASSVAGRVIVSSIDRPPSELIKPLVSARRVIIAIANPLDRASGS